MGLARSTFYAPAPTTLDAGEILMRIALYARLYSDTQSAATIEDQFHLCRQRAESEAWAVVDIFSDTALSGATTLRPGYQGLLARLRQGDVNLVVAETPQSQLDELEARCDHLRARLATTGVVRPLRPPNLTDVYRQRVMELERRLTDRRAPDVLEAALELIDEVIISPTEDPTFLQPFTISAIAPFQASIVCFTSGSVCATDT